MDSEAKKQGRDNFICADDIMLILKKNYEGSCVDRESQRPDAGYSETAAAVGTPSALSA